MIKKISQRQMEDCVTCVLAMVTGYSYEQVEADRSRYSETTSDGKFYEWWFEYLPREGFQIDRRPFMRAYDLGREKQTVGILGMTIERLKRRHVVALDAFGVVDPATGFPDHFDLAAYIHRRLPEGFVFDGDFLAIQPRRWRRMWRRLQRLIAITADRALSLFRPWPTPT